MTTRDSMVLSDAQAEHFGEELDALRREVLDDLGQDDVDHIRRIIRLCRYSEAGGRLMLHVGVGPVSFVLGVGALTLAKILENMEIGHNVMHGQYDWTRDPDLDSHTYEWDTACTGDNWRHYHNYEHHTFTNTLGKDRDIGYGLIRVSSEQPWNVTHLTQPVSALVLAALFQWGVAMHDLRVEEVFTGEQTPAGFYERSRPFLKKARWQLLKDYVLFPALALGNAPRVAAGNLLANLGRNLWTFAVIFCGHFPDGAQVFTEDDDDAVNDDSRGRWYLRQVNGSANIEGSRAFHVLTGHLSHQIEHHLFPELPASRYPQIAERLRDLCDRYGQRYNTGSFGQQLGSVARNIARYALPN